MHNASIIIKDKYLVGEILIKKDNNKIDVIESNISKVISGRRNIITLNTVQKILDQIKCVLSGMCFTSRFIGTDMYDNIIYDDIELKNEYIYGIQTIYYIPAGIVFYHMKNRLLFECTNIEFMINESIISFKFTDIDITKKYLIKRTNGDIQDAILVFNGGLLIHNDRIKIINSFNTNKDHELIYPYLGDLQKSIYLDDFLNINELTITISLPYFELSVIESCNDNLKAVLIYYNNKLNDFKNKLKHYINNDKIKIT